jgi:photosystem II stability/assembly factor-like uncharacterized protein
MRSVYFFLALFLTTAAGAQWQMLDAHTTADLRGIDNVGKGVVWASGTNGTVLRSEDGGFEWQNCAVPPAAEKLDFRGIQAFDNNTAIVMSSGPGELSRLYKTTDGCQSWKLLRMNTDPDGFWDAIVFADHSPSLREPDAGELVGDPVKGHFVVFSKMGPNWFKECSDLFAPAARNQESAFAASNSSILSFGRRDFMLATGGVHGSRVIFFHTELYPGSNDNLEAKQDTADVPIASGAESAGIFSLGERDRKSIVAVGGDFLKPNDSIGTAAFTTDGGKHWTAAATPPHGYRSSVAYDEAAKTWLTVGPNGTDISTDDGHDWRALKPAGDDTPDADKNWNALSLPFVVGPHGRIGMLRPSALVQSH